MGPDQRAALEAFVHDAIQRGDQDGDLLDEAEWRITRAVVDALLSGDIHTSTSMPVGFMVGVSVTRPGEGSAQG